MVEKPGLKILNCDRDYSCKLFATNLPHFIFENVVFGWGQLLNVIKEEVEMEFCFDQYFALINLNFWYRRKFSIPTNIIMLGSKFLTLISSLCCSSTMAFRN